MKIAYRRMSGKVGLSNFEEGTRGMWWEKRRALLHALRKRGHDVEIVSPLTKISGGMFSPYAEQEVLIVEFGSSNERFYGGDLAATREIVQRHQGLGIFVCDDPDLLFRDWAFRSPKSRWVAWFNATNGSSIGGAWPKDVPVFDMPFSSLQPVERYVHQACENRDLVYIGRPLGRTKTIRYLLEDDLKFVAYAKPAEWKGFDVEVRPPPAQVERAEFYRQQFACLALSDAKHKKLGWRTGRAFHAAHAGCPVIAEQDNPGFAGFELFFGLAGLRTFLELMEVESHRRAVREKQYKLIEAGKKIADATFRACGL